MSKEEYKEELLEILKGISVSLSEMNNTMSSIKDDGLTLNNQVTEAFGSAMRSGGFNDIFSAFSGGANSTFDVKDVLDSLKGGQGDLDASGTESAQSLIDSLREAKERLATISSVIGARSPDGQDESADNT
jgi:hypothetical protein